MNGGVIIAGNTYGGLGGNANVTDEWGNTTPNLFTIKYGVSGSPEWFRQIGGASCGAQGITNDNVGNIFITGWANGAFDGATPWGSSDAFIVKYDAAGQKQWTQLYGSEANEGGYSLVTAGDNIYVAGYTRAALDGNTKNGDEWNKDIFISKFDGNGAKIWTRQYGTNDYDCAYGLTTDGNNLYITGETEGGLDGNSTAGSCDIYVIKIGPKNEAPPRTIITSPPRGTATNSGNLLVSGAATISKPGVSIVNVEVSTDDGVTWVQATDTSGGSWAQWTYDWLLPLTDGQYTIKSRATDSVNNVEPESDGVIITIDRLAPLAEYNLTSINGGTYTISGTAGDNGGSGVNVVWLSVDGAEWTPPVDTSPDESWSSWSYDWYSTLGNHTFSCYATDKAGNVQSPVITWTITSIPEDLSPTSGKMYILNSYPDAGVSIANFDGTGGVRLGNFNGTLHSPFSVALDIVHGKIYVTNIDNDTVSRANLDGTGGESLGNLNGTLSHPAGIAVDTQNSKIYVANAFSNTVSRANLDGTGGESLGNLNGTLSNPTGIALDSANNKIYVTNFVSNTISQANLDGTGGVNLGDLNGTLSGPIDIVLDTVLHKMYVVNQFGDWPGSVSQANLDGTEGVNFGNLNGTLYYPTGIAIDIDSDKICVTNSADSTISQSNSDGSDGMTLGNLNNILYSPSDVALLPQSLYVKVTRFPDSQPVFGFDV